MSRNTPALRDDPNKPANEAAYSVASFCFKTLLLVRHGKNKGGAKIKLTFTLSSIVYSEIKVVRLMPCSFTPNLKRV